MAQESSYWALELERQAESDRRQDVSLPRIRRPLHYVPGDGREREPVCELSPRDRRKAG